MMHVIEDRNVLKAAEVLIDFYGPERAVLHAGLRADQLAIDGKYECQAVWHEIERTIELLTREQPMATETVH